MVSPLDVCSERFSRGAFAETGQAPAGFTLPGKGHLGSRVAADGVGYQPRRAEQPNVLSI